MTTEDAPSRRTTPPATTRWPGSCDWPTRAARSPPTGSGGYAPRSTVRGTMSTSLAQRRRGAAGSRSPCRSPRRLPSSSRWRSGRPILTPGPAPVPVARIDQAAGSPAPFTAGAAVMSGTTVTTAAGTLAMTLTSGVQLRLDASTTVRVDSATDVSLERGAVYVDSAGSPPTQPGASPIRIHTPAGLVRDLGTRFEVRLAGAGIRIRVRDGQVRVTGANRVDARAGAGEELFSTPDGSRSTAARLPPPGARGRGPNARPPHSRWRERPWARFWSG